jgi:hypothetical protein
MARRLGEVLAQRASEAFVGRTDELAELLTILDDDRPLVTYLHGIGGIGNSSLLDEFNRRAREQGAAVVSLDGRMVEPTPRGFLQELGMAIGLDAATPAVGADRLGSLSERVVLTIDTYELLRLMDTWLRQNFLPLVPDNVRIVLAGREPPVSAWLSSPGWQDMFHSIRLGSLSEEEAITLLRQRGISDAGARRINRVTDGHPLALQLAAANAHEPSRLDFADVAVQRVVEELARTYLADVPDPLTRRTLEAASVVRRITLPLLRAILPDIAPQDGYDRLRALPFVESSRDGLHIHDVIQHALAASLHAADPERHRALRSAAWHCLRADVRLAAPTDLWRYTADMLYLIENPIIREGFFPKDSHRFALEPALDGDGTAIREIITSTEGPESAQLLLQLWEQAPQIFRAARDRDGSIAGFYVMFDPDDVDAQVMRDDPILQHWLHHLAASPMPGGQSALFIRRWLGRGTGELPSPVQGATWLDLKRTYMELRPRLRRVYMTIWAMDIYGATAQELGFLPMPEAHVTLDQKTYYSAINDLGPQSVDGWLARLVGTELGIAIQDDILDIDARELVLNGNRLPLTKLEFETLRYLHDHEGKAVSRDELLNEVWSHSYQGGSNVIDVVVRSLRKKLGDQATTVETIWGTGYRYRRP